MAIVRSRLGMQLPFKVNARAPSLRHIYAFLLCVRLLRIRVQLDMLAVRSRKEIPRDRNVAVGNETFVHSQTGKLLTNKFL